MDSKDIIALAAYLHKLADPEQEAMPSFDNVDWRSLSYRCAKAIEALQADAERYRWLRDHECNSLYLTRNDEHAANYMTAKDWIREHQEDFQDDDQAEVSRMKETNTIWTLQIYPHTPIGFNLWHGSTPDVAIDAAMALDKP